MQTETLGSWTQLSGNPQVCHICVRGSQLGQLGCTTTVSSGESDYAWPRQSESTAAPFLLWERLA